MIIKQRLKNLKLCHLATFKRSWRFLALQR